MRRIWWLVSVLLCGALVAGAAAQSWQLTPVAEDFDPAAPLSRGLFAWLVVLPHQAGGPTWYAARGRAHGQLNNVDAGPAWVPSFWPGWYGALKFDGVNDYISLGQQPGMQCADTTCTLVLDVAAMVSPGASNVWLLSHHAGGGPEGYILRADPAGQLVFRLYDASGLSAGECNTVNLNLYDGLKHTITVVFSTSTGAPGNSTALIYVDGVVDSSAFGGANGAYAPQTTQPFLLGALPAPSNFIQGHILSFRFYTRGLSAPEVVALARAEAPTFGGTFVLPPLSLAGTLTPVAPKRKVVIQ